MENNLLQSNPRLVFVSHAGEDTWVARQIAKGISSVGAKTFLDEADIEVGAEFEEAMHTALGAADELLVLFTPWAFEKPYLWIEVGIASFRKIPIAIVLHGLSVAEFIAKPNALILLKKRDVIKLNDIDTYLN